MTNYKNAETLRDYYLTHEPRKTNVCKAKPNWNGCDYCDVYTDGLCWKQNGKQNYCHCIEEDK